MSRKDEMIVKLDDFEYDQTVELSNYNQELSYEEGISKAISFAKDLVKNNARQDKEQYMEYLEGLNAGLDDELSDKIFVEEKIEVYENYYWQLVGFTKYLIRN